MPQLFSRFSLYLSLIETVKSRDSVLIVWKDNFQVNYCLFIRYVFGFTSYVLCFVFIVSMYVDRQEVI